MSIARRSFLQCTGWSLLGGAMSGWLPRLAAAASQADDTAQAAAAQGGGAGQSAGAATRKRQCILLWMTGGPTQTDTFDMKPGHANGGEFAEIATKVPGVRFSEHLPKLAQLSDELAIVRSLSTKEGDHGRGTYLMHTGRQPQGPIRYPTLGSFMGKELGDPTTGVPSYVSVSPFRAFNQTAFSPGFLGVKYAPLTVGATDQPQALLPPDANGFAQLKVDDLTSAAGVTPAQVAARRAIWNKLQESFLQERPSEGTRAQDSVYRRAMQLMSHDVVQAFQLDSESSSVREAYGKGRFGQGCLLARRLIERGVPFVEVALGSPDGGGVGWDTHQGNFAAVKTLSGELDAGWSQLMIELRERGLLESTTIVWMGEFGRTPKINNNAGRDHFPAAWTCVLAGGGIKGGQAYGRTSADGTTVEENKVDVGDVLATLCSALGLDPEKPNVSTEGRPIKLAEGKAIADLVRGAVASAS